MKEDWLERYVEVLEDRPALSDVITGFNANIDVVTDTEELDIEDALPEVHDQIHSREEMREEVADAVQKCENREKTLVEDIEIEGEEKLGGQGGIASNFLARNGSGVVFYTPFLSEELAGFVDEHVLFPVMDGDFVLKNVRDASNTDRTKRNIIVEFEEDCTGRVIFSRRMKGFGPYFRKGIEDNFDRLEEGMDCAFLSGFHDTEGNVEAKLKKSREQLEKLELPLHLEYVHSEDVCDSLIEEILPAVHSIGMDEEEALAIAEHLGLESDGQLSLGKAYSLAEKLLKSHDLERVHIHTYRYHATFNLDDTDPLDVQEAMIFGELAAIACADTGKLPGPEQFEQLEFDDVHLHRTDELDHFEDFFDLEDFSHTGIGKVGEIGVVAIPTLIHEDPERLVGLGDVISSGAWAAENL